MTIRRRAGTTRRGPGRGALALVGALVLLGGFFWWAAGGAATAVPYSPSSPLPSGAEALALLLRQLGATVDTSGAFPAPGHGVILVLEDNLNDATRAQVLSWVDSGGTLVVTDPASPLEGASAAQGLPNQPATAAGLLAPACSAPWARGVARIDPDGDRMLEVPPGGAGCFGQGTAAFAVSQRRGAGVVVALGGPDLWSNAFLDHADNALLAANLLAPGPGPTVAWLLAPRVGGGDQTLWGLVPGRVKAFLAAAAVAVLVACLWRGRRLGAPVTEEPLVPVAASELAVAQGRLLARNRRFEEAASVLRDDLCGQLRPRLGQPPGSPPATVAQAAAARAHRPVAQVAEVLDGPVPADEEELLALAVQLQQLRNEVLGATRD